MDRRSFGRALAVIASSSLAFANDARASVHAIGRVVSVRDGLVDIQRRRGDRLTASSGLLLFSGDRALIPGTAELIVSIRGQIRRLTAADPDLAFSAPPVGVLDREDEIYFDRFADLLAEPPKLAPTYGQAREKSKTDFSLRASPVAPPGLHLVLDGLREIAIAWQGGAARVQVKPARGETFERSSGSNAWILIPVPEGTDQLKIQLADRPLQWSIRFVGQQELERRSGRPIRAGYAGRTRWAHETLYATPPAYDELRVGALSLLAHESRRSDVNSFFAWRAWTAAVNGEMARHLSEPAGR